MTNKSKKEVYWVVVAFFALNGAILMATSPEFGFWWWMGVVNLVGWGGYAVHELLEYLKS